MVPMRREARLLFDEAVDSFVLSVEHFNRPWDRGRHEAVLILLDRAFELVLKAAIVHRGGQIREPGAAETIGFDKCVRKCVSDAPLKCLTEEQALTIQTINHLRDSAQHYLLDISEQQLYIYARAGTSLFDTFLRSVFGRKLSDLLPERVLPLSTSPPRDIHALVGMDFAEIKKLVAPRSRKRVAAYAKLRALAIIEGALRGERSQPHEDDLEKLIRGIRAGKEWEDLFPGVACLRLDTSGDGLGVTIRITKKDGVPVTIVPEGTPGMTVVAVRRVDELSFYSLGLKDLAEKARLPQHKTLAVIQELELQNDPEFFKKFTIGKQQHKRYSPKALDRIQRALPQLDLEAVWQRHKPRGRKTTP